jgi:hypothetical protein
VTLDEARVALERGRHVVLVTPPAVEQAVDLWQLVPAGSPGRPGVSPPVLIICTDDVYAAAFAAAAPAPVRVHAVTGLARAARMLKEGAVQVLAGAVQDLAALVARSAVKLDAVSTVVVAWPETLVEGEHAAALDTLLGEARDARRVVLSWNPATLGDFLERHARRALIVGAPSPLPSIGPARYAVVPRHHRAAAVRDALDALDPKRPFIWEGGPLAPPPHTSPPDAVVCTQLPTREQFAALAALGEPVVFITAAQLPYLRSVAAPLTLLRLASSADRARDRADALRDQVARILTERTVDPELALLDPLFERFDAAEVAAALLALLGERGKGKGEPSAVAPPAAGWTKLFVNVGKKDRVAAKDMVGALIREAGLAKEQIGKIEVRETFSLIEVAPAAADQAAQRLAGSTIRGRRVTVRQDRER